MRRRTWSRLSPSAGLEPQALVREITEAAVVHDPESVARMLEALREMGVGLVLDDFGTGSRRSPCSTPSRSTG